MKNVILTLGIALFANVMFAANASDSLRTCISKIQATEATVQTLQRENETLKAEVSNLNSTITAQLSEVDSLKSVIAETNNSVSALADSLNT